MCFRRAELVNINEQKQKEALKEFYENEILKKNKEDRIKQLKSFRELSIHCSASDLSLCFGLLGCNIITKSCNLNIEHELDRRKIKKVKGAVQNPL